MLVFFFFFCFGAFAQDRPVNLKLQQAPFEEFIKHLEAQTGLTFYYDTAITDSLNLTVDVTNVGLKALLERVLKPQGIYANLMADNKVLLTQGQAFTATLAGVNFLGAGTDTTQRGVDVSHLTDYVVTGGDAVIAIENRLFEIGTKGQTGRDRILTGYVKDAITGNAIPFTTIQIQGYPQSVLTDQRGYFSISVPEERVTVTFNSVGKKDTQRQILMYSSGRIDVELDNRVYALDEVVVSSTVGSGVTRTQMGVERLSVATIKQTPTVFGEADIVRVVLSLPGVQTVGEAAGGFNVRGGATDQNLVLYNDATIYNPSHFFGFFSAFNPDAVNSIELYKSSVPARFGGRLSSVLDIAAREGNRSKFSGSGGVGLLTGRLTLEGPLGPKTSFLVGGRSTYSDWLMKLIPDDAYKNSSASFYDGNVHLNHDFNDKNSLYMVAYMSHDHFGLTADTGYNYQNINANVKWKSVLNERINSLLTLGVDGYEFNMKNTFREETAYDLNYQIRQVFAKLDLNHNVGERHRLTYGGSAIRYVVSPGTMMPVGGLSEVVETVLNQEGALEAAVHVTDVFQVNEQLMLDLGLRYSLFNVSGTKAATYHAPEVRLSARYTLSPNSSIKAGYHSMSQYIHMLSNTTSITPTDTWKLSDRYIKPQVGDQASLGYYHNFNSDRIETSVEVYYKRMEDYLDYKGGATLLMNPEIQEDVVGTQARAYGVEFLIKKLTGRLNGWLSYTYSKVEQRTVDVPLADMINKGAFYPSNHDKPHSLTLVGNYKFSHRLSFSLNGTYSTGRPITLPIAQYQYAGTTRVFYSDRNQYRIPDYFRVDAAFNIEGNHKVRKLAHSSWTVGVYNVTGRKNPFSVYYLSEPGGIRGYKMSIFGTQIPFVTYNFKF